MRRTICFLALLLAIGHAWAQPAAVKRDHIDNKLMASLTKAVEGFHGNAGVYVRNLKTNKVAMVNADSLFPTASMVKVPIMCGIFDKINTGSINYDQELIYRDSLKYDNGIVGSFKDSTKIGLPVVVHLMLSLSDNTGSLWLQALAGGGEAINAWLARNGFENTRVNSRTPGRKQAQATYGWGQTTPAEMAELVAMIQAGKAISPAASERMYRHLGMQFWDKQAISQIPPSVKIGSKSGSVNRARSEVLLVHAPHGDYVFCIATKNQQDQQWARDNEGSELIRKVSQIIWNHFEPKIKWQPLTDTAEWWY
jgi:beta-lactamase class A